jgi:hypothetical protein
MSKQLMLALGAGGAAAAAAVASAASIGTVNSTDLAAGTSVVAPCDSDGIDVSYTTEFNNGEYKVSSITLDGVHANCNGQDVKITLSDGTTSLGEATALAVTFTGTGNALTGDFAVDGLASAFPLASAVTGVAVVISG